MPLHHFLPPPHVVSLVLTAGLAITAGAILMSRRKRAANFASAGSALKNRLSAWRSKRGGGFGAKMSAMFAKCAASRSERWNPTGNIAFETYRSATLTELEREAAAFRKYLDELRHAKDKSEFDAFLEERRQTSVNETSSP